MYWMAQVYRMKPKNIVTASLPVSPVSSSTIPLGAWVVPMLCAGCTELPHLILFSFPVFACAVASALPLLFAHRGTLIFNFVALQLLILLYRSDPAKRSLQSTGLQTYRVKTLLSLHLLYSLHYRMATVIRLFPMMSWYWSVLLCNNHLKVQRGSHSFWYYRCQCSGR